MGRLLLTSDSSSCQNVIVNCLSIQILYNILSPYATSFRFVRYCLNVFFNTGLEFHYL